MRKLRPTEANLWVLCSREAELRFKPVLFLQPHAHLFLVHILLWIKKELPCSSTTVFVRPENLSLEFALAELTFDPPSSPVGEHEAGKEGYRAQHPPMAQPPPTPNPIPCLPPRKLLSSSGHQICLLPASCRTYLIFWASIPTYKEKPGFSLLQQVTQAPPQTLMCSLYCLLSG